MASLISCEQALDRIFNEIVLLEVIQSIGYLELRQQDSIVPKLQHNCDVVKENFATSQNNRKWLSQVVLWYVKYRPICD